MGDLDVAPKQSSPSSTSTSARRWPSLWPCCGWLGTTRTRRRSHWRPCWTARRRSPAGWWRRSCSRRSRDDALSDAGAAAWALERALDLAEPDSVLYPFLLHPHLVSSSAIASRRHTPPSPQRSSTCWPEPSRPTRREPVRLREPLTKSELRVLRYLPTNLTQPEIAAELYLSVNTVNTHISHLYTKLGTHRRGAAVERRAVGLLASRSHRS